MTVAPTEPWPSAAITLESPRRTQITVVERMRRPSARSMGWASPGKVAEADFTATGDFAEREKDGFMGNLQYIADRLPVRLSVFAFHFPLVPAIQRPEEVSYLSIYWQLAFPAISSSQRMVWRSVTETVPLSSEWPPMGYAFGQRLVLSLIPLQVPLPLR